MMTDEQFEGLVAAEAEAWQVYRAAKEATEPLADKWLELHRQREKESNLRAALAELRQQEKIIQ